MGYRKADIPGMIECLRDVRRRLWRGEGHDAHGAQFICPITHNREAHAMVGEALSGHYTLECWLRAVVGIEPNDFSNREMQAIRVQWLNKMIADLQEYAKS